MFRSTSAPLAARLFRAFAALALPLLLALAPAFSGCDGGGLAFPDKTTDSGDNPPPDDGGDDGPIVPPPAPDAGPFEGTWVAAYGDDRAADALETGVNQYALRLVLEQDSTALSGTGRVVRVLTEGATAVDELSLRADGTASEFDATLTLTPEGQPPFDFQPTWRLRLGRNGVSGIYATLNADGAILRSGHALWLPASTGGPGRTWSAAVADAAVTTDIGARARTSTLTLAENSGSTISGQGRFIELRPGRGPLDLSFNVVDGFEQNRELGFTLGALDLASVEMDWFAHVTGTRLVGVYAQYNSVDVLTRAGNAVWFETGNPAPDDLRGAWVTGFSDLTAVDGVQPSSYTARMELTPREGGGVSGSMRLLDQAEDTGQYATYTVVSGSMTGTAVRLTAEGPLGAFEWNLRMAGQRLVGGYQLYSASGAYVAQGTAEWRRRADAEPRTTWTASYFDRFAAEGTAKNPQLAVVTINSVNNQGELTGLGSLRFAGENTRRLFNVSGSRTADGLEIVLSGPDLFGDTIWSLQESGPFLYGSYANLTAQGQLETFGHAAWQQGAPE